MVVWIQCHQGRAILHAQREPLNLKPENQRYWTGEGWAKGRAEAQIFASRNTAKEYREAHRLSEQIPAEWSSQ